MASSGDDKRPSQVLDHLFIGSRSHAKNRGLLKELGINRILNVTPPKTMDPTNGVPNFFEKDRSMTYKRVAVFDNRGEDLIQHLDSCIAFIEQGSFYGKVLVHCNKGVSRSSTVVAAYLMSTRGLSKDEAMKYLRSRRSIVCPHEGFMSQLEAFDGKLKEERGAAIAEGRPKKYPDDLLQAGSRGGHQGPSIGPSRGPPVAVPGPNKRVRNRSPPRAGEMPSREMPSIGPPRGPSVAVPGPDKCVRDRSPPRLGKTPQGASIGPSIGPSRGPSITVPGPKKCARSTSPLREEATREREIGPSPPRQRVTMIGPPRGPSPPVPSLRHGDAGSRERSSSEEAQTGGAARESSNTSGVVPLSESANRSTLKQNSYDCGEIEPALIGPPTRPRSGQREDKEPNMGKVSEKAVGMIGPVLERPRDVNDVSCNAAGLVPVENGDCGAVVGSNKRKREGEGIEDDSVGSAHKARIDERCTAVSEEAEG